MTFFVLLLIAHFVGDFMLQPKSWVDDKFAHGIKSSGLKKHIAVHALLLLALALIYPAYIWQLLIILVGHFIIDVAKIMWVGRGAHHTKNIAAFIIDQLLHIALIIAVCATTLFTIDWTIFIHPKLLWIVLGYIFLTLPAAAIMRILLSPYDEDIASEDAPKEKSWKSLFFGDEDEDEIVSLKNGGKYIGIIERLLIYTFILIGQWTAVGFLITAKSVFRFGDLNQGKNRQFTEYVLIGTLLSFSLAIGVGLMIQFILPNVT